MGSAQLDPEHLAAELAAASPALDPPQQRLAISLYRLLAEGAPVARGELAERARADEREVARFLDEHPGVYLDDEDRVVGFWGLALAGMPHRLTVGPRELSAWCAWDTLFLPELLGSTVTV